MTHPALFSLVAAGAACWVPSGGEPIDVPAGQRQLFLDDYCVARIENLDRTMHQPEKKGAVLKPDRPWELWIQTRSMPAWDEDQQIYKLWLWTCFAPGAAAPSFAQSKDGIHWIKPILGQYKAQGSLENNFLAVDPKLHWPANAMPNVVCDPDDPDPGRRYKGFLGAHGRQPIVSPDGIHWKRLEVPKIPSSDESNLSYDRSTRTFIAMLKRGGPFGRSYALSTSRDFKKWTAPELVFHADAEDQRRAKANIRERLSNSRLQQPVYNNPAEYNADVYNIGVFRYEGLYVGLPAVYHATGKRPDYPNTDGFHLIQLACSRDLHTWKRLADRQTFIGPSPAGEGAYDTMQLLPPSGPVVRGDELWFYYTGLRYRAPPEGGYPPNGGAVCLAVFRRDGFISLDAGEQPGTLLTRPFVLPAARLLVNVDAAGGALDVEVLDSDQNALAVSKPVVGDQPRAAVEWKSGHLADLKGQTVSLRFTLRKAKLYSFWF